MAQSKKETSKSETKLQAPPPVPKTPAERKATKWNAEKVENLRKVAFLSKRDTVLTASSASVALRLRGREAHDRLTGQNRGIQRSAPLAYMVKRKNCNVKRKAKPS